jgi:hypothetical protein
MPNRREFLQIGLASSALPILAGERSEASFYDSVNRLRIREVIVEMSSPPALAFRAEAVELGLKAYGIHDDITDLWYNVLDRRWKSAPAALAGITLSTSLFCLETFARDYGMRVWFRALHDKAEHDKTEPGPMVSWIIAPRGVF